MRQKIVVGTRRRGRAGTALVALVLGGTMSVAGCSHQPAAPATTSPGLTGATGAAARSGTAARPSRTLGSSDSGSTSTTTSTATGGPGTTTAPSPAAERPSVIDAWTDSERAFYAAGRLARPHDTALDDTFAPGSPALRRTTMWLELLRRSGVIAPAAFRIGNAEVVSIGTGVAVLTGCTYDTGSVYRSSGMPAPVALGGGASFTASVAELHDVDGHWLVWSDQTSTPRSSEVSGPCHGF